MRRFLGVTAALALGLPIVASAAEIKGKVVSTDVAASEIVLENGTRLTVDSSNLVDIKPGTTVRASYETKSGKNIVTDLEPRAVADGVETTNFAAGQPLMEQSFSEE
ncbi:MAG: DUF1344 domain-containing protein [Candidatus Rokuibacteriota bacterium]